MVEFNYKTIGALLLLIIVTATSTVHIQKTTKYKTCSTGWILQENGQFVCESRDILPQWCYDFSDANEAGISSRCYLGSPVEIEEPKSKIELKETITSGDYTTSPNGLTCYVKGDLRRGVPCDEI